MTFPLCSKRLQLYQVQCIAKALELPTAASSSDLLVMVCGRLSDNNHDPSNTQVVVTRSEEGEELSLQDIEGVFLRIPVLKSMSSSISLSPSSEVPVESLNVLAFQKKNSISAQVNHLEYILSSMEQELAKTQTQLLESPGGGSRPEKGSHSILWQVAGSPEGIRTGEKEKDRAHQ